MSASWRRRAPGGCSRRRRSSSSARASALSRAGCSTAMACCWRRPPRACGWCRSRSSRHEGIFDVRRAERLFQIIQILRRSKRRPITAGDIAGELETSLRTLYRDISQLLAERVPIRGEAGIGYILEDGFDMPPLMLTADEIEAAMLGAQ